MNTKKCRYCLSDIPEKAEKCKFCIEWQDEKETIDEKPQDKKFLSFDELFPYYNKPFQVAILEKIPSDKALYKYVSVLVFGVICFVIVKFSWYRIEEKKIYLLSFLAFIIQMIFSWSFIIWFDGIIKENYPSFFQISPLTHDKAKQIFIKYYNLMFNKAYCIIAGIIIGLTASIGDYILEPPFCSVNANYAKKIFAVLEFMNMFFTGAGIFTMLVFGLFVYKISSNPESSKIDNINEVINVGRIHLQTSIMAIVTLFLGILGKIFGEWRWVFLVILWYSSFAIAIFFYIYLPMMNIHKLLKENIDHQIKLIQLKVQEIIKDININPSSRNFIKLNNLKEIKKSISSESTWPFGTKNLSAFFFAIILPIVLMIVDKIWNIGG